MELFDLVDANDNVIGVTNKEQAHRLKQLHRVVAVFVFNKKGDLLIQSHISTGYYDHSVGGHVQQGESYNDASKREAFEELGITDSLSPVVSFLSDDDNGHWFSVYEVTPSEKWKFVPNEEVKEITPMPVKDIVDLMNNDPSRFTRGFRWTMFKYIKTKKLPYTINPEILTKSSKQLKS